MLFLILKLHFDGFGTQKKLYPTVATNKAELKV